MPAKPPSEPESVPAPAPETSAPGDGPKAARQPAPDMPTDPEAAPEETTEPDVPAGRLPAGVYEFTGPIATQYLEIPLTARPADPGSPARPATEDGPAVAGVPPTPATVFDWPFGAPDDGRWKPVKRKPNSLPDNAPADSEE